MKQSYAYLVVTNDMLQKEVDRLRQQAATLADALETAKNQLEAVRKAGFRASSITIAQHKAESALAAYKESK